MGLFAYASNFLTEALISPSSLVPSQNPQYIERYVAGSATMEIQGTYTATVNTTYVVFISYADEVAGVRRYDWSDTGGVGPWNAVGMTIVPNIWQTLNNGLQIRFIAGVYSPQLVVGDRFRFHIERPYRPAHAVDLNRESTMRSDAIGAGGTYIVTFPFATNMTPDTLLLQDYNGPSNATMRLQASTTSNFASTPFNNIVPWAQGKIRYALPTGPTRTYPYWRLHITVVGAVPYLEMSGLYLGTEIAFTREFDMGFRKSLTLLGGSDASILARGQGRYGIQPQRYELTFSRRAPSDDLTKFDTLWNLTHPLNGSQRPFYLYFDSVASLPIFELFNLEGDLNEAHDFLDRSTPSMSLIQLVRTAA